MKNGQVKEIGKKGLFKKKKKRQSSIKSKRIQNQTCKNKVKKKNKYIFKVQKNTFEKNPAIGSPNSSIKMRRSG